jgi:hypothetical protein
LASLVYHKYVLIEEELGVGRVTMKERRPTRMVETCHEGFHSLGWKSEKEKQRRVFVWKRPTYKHI